MWGALEAQYLWGPTVLCFLTAALYLHLFALRRVHVFVFHSSFSHVCSPSAIFLFLVLTSEPGDRFIPARVCLHARCIVKACKKIKDKSRGKFSSSLHFMFRQGTMLIATPTSIPDWSIEMFSPSSLHLSVFFCCCLSGAGHVFSYCT